MVPGQMRSYHVNALLDDTGSNITTSCMFLVLMLTQNQWIGSSWGKIGAGVPYQQSN